MEEVKVSFFKRVKRAIFNLEQYSNFILEKTSIAIKYLLKLIVIFTIIISLTYTYDFYKNGVQEETIETLEQYGFEEVEIEKVKEVYSQINETYFLIIFFVIISIVIYITMVITTSVDIILFSVLTLIIGRICKMKLNFKQAFNLVVYAITLPYILLTLYIMLELLFQITIRYFFIAYDAITYIYIITALLMLRADLIKQKIEVAKIVKEQEKIKREEEGEKEQKKEEEEKQKREKKEPKVEGEPEANKA